MVQFQLDPLAFWKVISVGLTGAFGIMGLLTEYKDPATKKITRWGYVSLAGILLSAVGGMAAQFVETNRELASSRRTAEETRHIASDTRASATRTEAAVAHLRRLMSPVSTVFVDMELLVDRDHGTKYRRFCGEIQNIHRPGWPSKYLAHGPNGNFVPLGLVVHFDPPAGASQIGLTLRFDGRYSVVSVGNGPEGCTVEFRASLEPDEDTEGVRSFLDLQDARVDVSFPRSLSIGTSLRFIELSNSAGDRLGPLDRISSANVYDDGTSSYTFTVGKAYIEGKLAPMQLE